MKIKHEAFATVNENSSFFPIIYFLQHIHNQISLTDLFFFFFITYLKIWVFSLRSDKDLANQERSMTLQRERTSAFRSLKSREVKIMSPIHTNCLLILSE